VDQERDFTEEFKEIVEILINIQNNAIRNIDVENLNLKFS